MSDPLSRPDDPLAAMAKATAQSIRSEEAANAGKIAARDEAARTKNRLLRAGVAIMLVVIITVSTVLLVRNIADPYHGVDLLANPAQAKAYVAALLDSVMEWSSRNGGQLPHALDAVVPQGRLLPPGSAYRLEYRVEGGVAVVVLHGGKEPIVMRGGGK
jgi:plasmid stabilization system protein ParE